MTTRTDDTYLWLDRYAARLGFERLSARLPWDVPPSYLYGVLLILVIDPVLNAWAHASGYRSVFLDNPYFVLQPLALVASIYASRSLVQSYDDVMTEMAVEERTDSPERLTEIVPDWLPWAVFAVGAGYLYVSTFATGLDAIYRTDGPVGVFAGLVINPLVWVPIAAQFLSVYLSLELLAPYRLVTSDVGIHFYDPEGLGGLRPIGELLKQAYYFMMLGLICYALILYHPLAEVQGLERSPLTDVTFTAIWVVTIATVAFAVFTLHRFMHREKRAELQALEAELRSYVDNPWDVKHRTVPDGDADRVAELQRRMEIVSGTNEYPATFSIWSQLLLAVVLPKGVQLFLSGL
ncbi:hypothetical protein [Halobacterium yunchengense]|uniref:hypothetical protein n=1 Tax=Halobacterium yunchengense TaxID=3108497 RepID=UPI00300AB073